MSRLSDSENCRRNLEFLRNPENARTRSHSFPRSSATLKTVSKTRFNIYKKNSSWRETCLKPTTSMCNQEDKENTGYENFDNTNVAASPLILFHCSGKECRPQEPCESPESANQSCSTKADSNKIDIFFTSLSELRSVLTYASW
jgi:hypothetical protein